MSGYCEDLVRAGDRDRYLAFLFASPDKRPHLYALHAFDLELSRIRDAVSEPALGEIRLQFWLDALDAIEAGKPVDPPVAIALSRAVAECRLSISPLRDLALARRFDLYDEPSQSLDALELYLGRTRSVLLQLSALVLAGDDAAAAAAAAGLAGVAWGLAQLLRTRPTHLPRELQFAAAIAHARRRLAEARALTAQIPKTALPAFLPVSLTDLYLDRLEKGGTDVPQFRRQLRLWRMARRNAF